MKLLVAVGAFATMTVASAADECLTARGYNICEAAVRIQQKFASSLPMQVSDNVTVHSALVFGRRLSFHAVWAQSNAELTTMLEAGGITKAQLVEKVGWQTKSMICGQFATNAFVQLGGEVEYNYRTSDAVPVATALVDDCPQP
ncbi:hypothetical protein [Aminobacter carboxidus]|uniref:Uncharacterized protein n=1 Tax=Aminobacter carboxidus TaxID=376165 RepID=A0A8E1WF41_9HYPH|nr:MULTISPECIES: hypothetical protein [Aminobacter carboxidus group]MBB6466784.1 hypothetical protein [Aminobacter lissarensis]MBE1203170.1 hypothetical protein [Aminobacter carboxidus]